MIRLERLEFGGSVQEVVERLFPFHLVVDFDASSGEVGSGKAVVSAAGSQLLDWTGVDLVGDSVGHHLTVVRPGGIEWDLDQLVERLDSVFFIGLNGTERQLRYQCFPLVGGEALFVGSPLVTSSSSLDDLGLKLSDFALHDASADVAVMARFTALQVRDIERKTRELQQAIDDRNEFHERASTDALTGIANRWGFWKRVERALEQAHTDNRLGLVYIDMDGFKGVNDSYGHMAGDEVLRAVAQRISMVTRDTDVPARLGGDEFAILLSNFSPENSGKLLARLQDSIQEPVETSEGSIAISASIGVTSIEQGQSIDDVLRDADTAMYAGRSNGQGTVTWSESEMGVERAETRLLTSELTDLLVADELELAFQPIVCLPEQTIVGFEALARWTHPDRGSISPAVFVGLAERAGLVGQLDLQVIEKAITTIGCWRKLDPGLRMHVNLSGLSIDDRLPSRIQALLVSAGVEPEALAVEVTESRPISSDQIPVLQKLSTMGLPLELDDFGTGFSSLTHIQSLPLSGLKIDRSFVQNLTTSPKDQMLVSATVNMASSLDLSVVAEGVEDEAAGEMLASFGCQFAQGYLFSRPLPEADAKLLIATKSFSP